MLSHDITESRVEWELVNKLIQPHIKNINFLNDVLDT